MEACDLMTTTVHSEGIGEEGSRKRRAHKKSRGGCRNCKLRRVKCDETRPNCKKCTTFGVSCNYDVKTPDLQMSFNGIATLKSPQKQPCSTNQALLGKIEVPACLYPAIITNINSTFQLDRQCLDRLGRFYMRTVLSIGTTRAARLFQSVLIETACTHPYLMHVVQTLTAIHDRYLSASPNSGQTITEVYRLSRAAALFNRKLSAPIQPPDCDALWATAALLGIIAFSSIEASKPEEAWPLRNPEPSDLEWIRMSESKMAIWNITNPLRPDSVFHTLADEYKTGYLVSAVPRSGIEGIPSVFIQLYGLDNSSSTDNSPYHAAVHAFAPLLSIECDQSTIARFLSFICHMHLDFKRLLEQKDPRALLLLSYWYAKVCHSVWWIERRATLECQATCIYLERHHAGETAIQELLQFPKMRCGLVA